MTPFGQCTEDLSSTTLPEPFSGLDKSHLGLSIHNPPKIALNPK